jgi:hypothetical protein
LTDECAEVALTAVPVCANLLAPVASRFVPWQSAMATSGVWLLSLPMAIEEAGVELEKHLRADPRAFFGL